MMIKSHLQGRDEKERWKEVMLEEHTEVILPPSPTSLIMIYL